MTSFTSSPIFCLSGGGRCHVIEELAGKWFPEILILHSDRLLRNSFKFSRREQLCRSCLCFIPVHPVIVNKYSHDHVFGNGWVLQVLKPDHVMVIFNFFFDFFLCKYIEERLELRTIASNSMIG